MSTFIENYAEYNRILNTFQENRERDENIRLLNRVLNVHEKCKTKLAKKAGKLGFSMASFGASAVTLNVFGAVGSVVGGAFIAEKLDQYIWLDRQVKSLGRRICHRLGLENYNAPTVGMISRFCEGFLTSLASDRLMSLFEF